MKVIIAVLLLAIIGSILAVRHDKNHVMNRYRLNEQQADEYGRMQKQDRVHFRLGMRKNSRSMVPQEMAAYNRVHGAGAHYMASNKGFNNMQDYEKMRHGYSEIH
jgi:uncharacterized protein YxeA